MNLADVIDQLGDRLETISGLRVYRYPPDNVQTPAAFVDFPESYTYDETYGRGMDRMTVPVIVAVSRDVDRTSVGRLGAYVNGDGPQSIKSVIEGDATENFLNLPGGANNFVVSSHRSIQSITGRLWMAVDCALDDWTPSTNSVLIAKFGAAFNVRAYRLHINTSGQPIATISSTGANELSGTGTALGFTDGTRHAIGVEVVPDDGNGNRTFQFYTADTIDGPWTAHGSLISQAGAVSIFATTQQLAVGADSQGVFVAAGDVWAAEIRSGDKTGTLVANPDFRVETPGAPAFIDQTGSAWVMGGTSSIEAGPGLPPYTAFDTARVVDVEFTPVQVAGVIYLGADLSVDIAGTGAS